MANVEGLHKVGKEIGEMVFSLKDGIGWNDVGEIMDVPTAVIAVKDDIDTDEIAAAMNIAAGILDYAAEVRRKKTSPPPT